MKIDRKSTTPIYLQISHQIMEEIASGRMAAGLKLPGTRKLSEILAVNRNTVIAAIDELKSQGWLVAKDGKGTYVSSEINELVDMALFDSNIKPKEDPINFYKEAFHLQFDDGHPDVRLAPLVELAREMSALVKTDYFHRNLNYTENFQGDFKLRIHLVDYLKSTRGINVSTENLLITRGSIMSFHLLVDLLIVPGDKIIVGNPGYQTFNKIVERKGGELIFVDVDDDGLMVDQIEQLCEVNEIKIVYAIPHHHHPTTVRLIAERRMKLIELARKYEFMLLEDDYDYDFHYDNSPILPLASYAQLENLIYFGSFSKLLVPSIRLGFLIADIETIEALKISRRLIDRCGDPLIERGMANLLEAGTISRYLRKSKRIYRRRRDLLIELLKNELAQEISFEVPAGGMAIWVCFAPHIHVKNVIKFALKQGLYVSDPENYQAENKFMTRLGFASMNEEELIKAFKILKDSIKKSIV